MIRKFFREREFLFLATATIAYFYAPLFGGKTFFFRDLYMFYYPQRLHLVQMIRSGEWPLWDPYLHGGMPFLGEVANLVFYPTTLFYLILPTLTAFNIEIVFHVLLAALATYVLCRQLGMNRSAAMLSGAIYAFCGYSLSCVNLFIRLLALPLVPLLLLFWHRFLNEHRRVWFLAAVITTFAFVLTGSVENLAIALLFVLAWSLLFPYNAAFSKRIFLWVLLFVFGAGLALIQILPSIETVEQSLRGEGYRYAIFSAWSFHPLRIPEIFFPEFFGYTNRMRSDDYWGIGLEHYFPYILSVYLSIGVVVLVVRGIAADKASNESEAGIFSKTIRLYLIFFAILFVALSFGFHLPGFALLHKIPFFDSFRYPLKFLAGAILPLALLAGLGLQRDFKGSARPGKLPMLAFWCMALAITAFCIALRMPHFASRFVHGYFESNSAEALRGVYQSIFHGMAIWWMVVLIYQYRRLSPRFWQQSLLASVLFFDLLWAGSAVNEFAPREFFTDTPKVVSLVREQLAGGRFLRSPTPPNMRYFLPANDIVYGDRWNLETLENYSGALYNIPLIFHENYDGLAPLKITHLAELGRTATAQQESNILRVSGVSLILSAQTLSLPDAQASAVLQIANNQPFYLYRTNQFQGRAWFSSQIRSAADSNEALKVLLSSDFQPVREAIVEHPSHLPRSGCDSSRVMELARSATQTTYTVTTLCEGYVVFAEVFYPGWKFLVDEKPVPIERANYAYSAIFVSPGTHTIKRYYHPASFFWGAGGSFVTALLLALLIKSKILQTWVASETATAMGASARRIQEV